jgi:hypothetical protein
MQLAKRAIRPPECAAPFVIGRNPKTFTTTDMDFRLRVVPTAFCSTSSERKELDRASSGKPSGL